MSLPGSNEISIEQPAILQVLSPINATEEKEHTKPSLLGKEDDDANECPVNVSQRSSEDIISHNENVIDDANSRVKNLVSSSSTDTDHLDKTTNPIITNATNNTTASVTQKQTGDDQSLPETKEDCKTEPFVANLEEVEEGEEQENEEEDEDEEEEEESSASSNSQIIQANILDIESHLIETLNETTPSKESVGINELQPVEDELQVGCSKVETEGNVRSVIEVEPAEVVTKQPVEQIIETEAVLQAAQIEQILSGPYLNGETPQVNREDIEKAAQQLLQDIEEEVVKAFETNTYKGSELQKPEKKEEEVLTEENTETLSTLENEGSDEQEEEELPNTAETVAAEEEEGKVEESSEDQVDSSQARTDSQLSQVVDQQLSEVTSILDSQTKETTSLLKPPAGPNLKLVTVPTPQTASEEAERKLFIDSLPPLQTSESSDAEKLALDCKREYYQSLKKYLVQSNTDKPPVPLQTYRWEDLRRAKERVSINGNS